MARKSVAETLRAAAGIVEERNLSSASLALTGVCGDESKDWRGDPDNEGDYALYVRACRALAAAADVSLDSPSGLLDWEVGRSVREQRDALLAAAAREDAGTPKEPAS